jgi:predicted CopG family antitoxin
MNERKTITISREAFEKLKTLGTFGESYNDLVMRLMDELVAKVGIKQT